VAIVDKYGAAGFFLAVETRLPMVFGQTDL
jgi:hypothetical protein